MTTSITTLALSVLVSERVSQRSIFAAQIIERVKKIEHNSQKDVEIFNGLTLAIDQCVVDPSAAAREDLHKLAQWYDQKLST